MHNRLTSSIAIIWILFISLSSSMIAQNIAEKPGIKSLSLEECFSWSRENFPLLKQLDIIDRTEQYNLSNASKVNLPQVNFNGQASYQSAVTELPLAIPNLDIPSINKDQYKIYGELYQSLTGFSNVNTLKGLTSLESKIEKQKVEIELYKLKDRVHQVYFGVLLINEKIKQYKIFLSDIDSTMTKVRSAIVNGTATNTDIQILSVERISLEQLIEENQANKSAYLEILSTLTKKHITEQTNFKIPPSTSPSLNIVRPELQLYNLQSQTTSLKEKRLNNTLIPHLGLFAQVGYGRPALNFLSNDFDFYYIGGIKLNWNISRLYTHKNSKNALHLLTDKIANERETFLLNTSLTQSQQSAEIIKYNRLIKSDETIVNLRTEILNTAKIQLSNGLITTFDYVKILNDLNRASQSLILHQTQLLLSQYNLKSTRGN